MELSNSIIGKITIGVVTAILTAMAFYYLGIDESGRKIDPDKRQDSHISMEKDISNTSTSERKQSDITSLPSINYSMEKASIKNLIRQASDIEIGARKNLVTTNLSRVYKGDALKMVKSSVNELKNNAIFELSTLHDQEFIDIEVYQESRNLFARVEWVGTWSSHYHRLYDNLCLSHLEPLESPQTLYMEKTSEGWYITAVDFKSTPDPVFTPCNRYEY